MAPPKDFGEDSEDIDENIFEVGEERELLETVGRLAATELIQDGAIRDAEAAAVVDELTKTANTRTLNIDDYIGKPQSEVVEAVKDVVKDAYENAEDAARDWVNNIAQEWIRDYVRLKIARYREDKLDLPDEERTTSQRATDIMDQGLVDEGEFEATVELDGEGDNELGATAVIEELPDDLPNDLVEEIEEKSQNITDGFIKRTIAGYFIEEVGVEGEDIGGDDPFDSERVRLTDIVDPETLEETANEYATVIEETFLGDEDVA